MRKLVELHQESVTVASCGHGKGSTFTVWLPLAERTGSTRAAGSPTIWPNVATAEPLRRQRILVVDDNADAASSLATPLEMLGHDVSTAVDGTEAILRAQEQRPDVISMDIGMPRLGGIERHGRSVSFPAAATFTSSPSQGGGRRTTSCGPARLA